MQRYQTVVFEYRGENTTAAVGILDGLVTLQEAYALSTMKRCYIKPISCQMSTRIPNIFNYGQFNNTIIRVKRNVADAWTTITFPPGIYNTTIDIQAAITASVPTWYTDPYLPALAIGSNTVTDQVFITLDSSKLAPGGTQMCVDLSQSKIAYTLGFPTASTFIADGLYTSTLVVRLDAQGTFCDVTCSLTNARIVNGACKKILFSVPLTLMSGLTEYMYPINGNNVPLIQYTGSNYISNFSIEFKTQDNVSMVWLPGSKVQVIFEFEQEI